MSLKNNKYNVPKVCLVTHLDFILFQKAVIIIFINKKNGMSNSYQLL